MRSIAPAVVAAVAAVVAAAAADMPRPDSASAFKVDVARYDYDDSSYNYCDAEYPLAKTYSAVPGAQLELVQMMVRHGDRTPVNYIPHNDTTWTCDRVGENTYLHGAGEPDGNTTGAFRQVISTPEWNHRFGFSNQVPRGSCEEGELTDRGKSQHRTLGARLRQIYVDKLGYLPAELKSADALYVRTTYIWRTKNSAQSLLGGLWPGRSMAPSAAIPLHTYPSRIETMFGNTGACPQIVSLLSQITASDGYQRFLKDQGPLMTRLTRIFDVGGSHWTEGWDGYFDVLHARQCHGKRLPCAAAAAEGAAMPECATADDAALVARNANYEWAYKYRDCPLAHELTRLTIGSFVGTLREQMDAHIAGKAGGLKLALYSGHDSTVWPLLAVLGADNRSTIWPPYASNLIFELWKKQDGQRVVRVIFNGQVLKLAEGAEWCDMNACPLDTFLAHIDTFVPTDIATECSTS
ncbi:hypothetical protein LPJ61_000020 [Coemansia biformis]|uniref:Phosphoglycerate mutase-like protein n=1 Tax=Coemansia biformis TaxID=1286918 RepID=A0A9W7YCB7_9FUNG|nr:hypothetical protein LPJ61_000020 [Coemansia biformis]